MVAGLVEQFATRLLVDELSIEDRVDPEKTVADRNRREGEEEAIER